MKKKVFVGLLIVALLLSLTGLSLAEDQASPVITRIEVRGNAHIGSRLILEAMETKVGDTIDNEKLKQDLQNINQLGYFYNVRAGFESLAEGVKLIIEVVEHPVLKDVIFEGNTKISDEELMSQMKLEAGKVINSHALDESVKAIRQVYQDRGYILAYVKDLQVEEGILTLTIDEGAILDVEIRGNEKTKDYVIMREIDLKPGEVFSIERIKENMGRIYNLGFFKDIKLQLDMPDKEENDAVVILNLEEKKTGNFQIGGAYSSRDGLIGYMSYSEKNFLGNGQRIGLKWEFGSRNTYQFNFHEPWFFGHDLSLDLNLYNYNFDRSEEINDTMEDYLEHRTGGSIAFGKDLVPNWFGNIRLKVENFKTDYANDSLNLDEEGSTRSLTLRAVHSTITDLVRPTKGSYDTFSVEYAGGFLGGDSNFTKYQTKLNRYYPGFKDQHVWVLSFQGGWITSPEDIPPHEEFHIGGGQTIRGYENGSITGDTMGIFTVEYRLPIVKSLDLAAFVDVGNAWHEQVNLDDLKAAGGLGLIMNTPLGQLRLDYGISKEGAMPSFSIGQSF